LQNNFISIESAVFEILPAKSSYMISLEKIRTDIAVDHAVKCFVPFARSLLEQGFTDIPSDQFQRGLSAVATLPSQYIGIRELIDGIVRLTTMTHGNIPINIVKFTDADAHDINVSITLQPNHYEAKILSPGPDGQRRETFFRKLKGNREKWYPVSTISINS
jgi:hypothetical protein